MLGQWTFDIAGRACTLDGEHVVRLIVAVVLGGLIGIEREFRDKPAGFRTIILIACGACVFSIVSQMIAGPNVDNTRIAAQVVTGVGFLGAGAIIRDAKGVFGLTTAATIWAVASVGVAVGFGYLLLGTAAAAAILVVLFFFDIFEGVIGRVRDVQDYCIGAVNKPGAYAEIVVLFQRAGLRAKCRQCYEDGRSIVCHISAIGSKRSHDELRERITTSDAYTLRKP
ncbi:MAG: MgtC/SapB family protein [Phycisphaerae bacterium]